MDFRIVAILVGVAITFFVQSAANYLGEAGAMVGRVLAMQRLHH
jgi:hypothetical protein